MDLAASAPFGTMCHMNSPLHLLVHYLHLRNRHLPQDVFVCDSEHLCINVRSGCLTGSLYENLVIVHQSDRIVTHLVLLLID